MWRFGSLLTHFVCLIGMLDEDASHVHQAFLCEIKEIYMSTAAITGGSTSILLNTASESAGINWWGASVFILFHLLAIAFVIWLHFDKKKNKQDTKKRSKPDDNA